VDEAVFKAHGFDWQKVIFISQNEFDCLSAGEPINWEPYRELFRIGETYYLMEKSAVDEPNCSVYQFSSTFSFNSWNIAGEVAELDLAKAQEKYFAPCVDGGALFVRAGTLLKPTFAVSQYGAGVIFVVSGKGVLLPFADWSTFVSMGYDKLPLSLISENDFSAGFLIFGALIDKAQSETCASGQGFVIGAFGEADNDADGVSAEAGDCDDQDPLISPNEAEVCDYVDNNCNGLIDEGALNACGDCGDVPPEVCDGVDNDCDGVIDEGVLNACGDCGSVPPEVCDDVDNDCDGSVDEGELCGPGLVCAGICLETLEEPLPEEQPAEEEAEPLPAEEGAVPLPDPVEEVPADEPKFLVNESEQIICSVKCPAGMKAYIWYASDGQVSGSTAIMESSKTEICLRGQPWIDFNCACTVPQEWSCFDPGAAQVECNHAFVLQVPGVIDAKGEGEAWFTDFQCFFD